jgi:hypothetical protein
MYGLPKDINLHFLEGQELGQVCVGMHEVILNFSRNTGITIQSKFSSSADGSSSGNNTGLPLSASSLLRFVGSVVTSIHAETDGTLKLQFSNGLDLTIFDDDPHYESYVINHNGAIVVV